MATAAERRAMVEAISLAGTTGFAPGTNPRVGCIILDASGRTVGEGAHLGAGSDHAEVVALAQAGPAARGATVVVTLEPCAHQGRTPPCADALIDAGVERVIFGQEDPNPIAAGGATRLAAAGISVEGGVMAPDARGLNPEWTVAVTRATPYVTLKVAATLDGHVAAADGSSRWITSEPARRDAHALRASVGAVLVGTGTALADDPALTDRRSGAKYQPRPAVMGFRDIPDTHQLGTRDPLLLKTHDVDEALSDMYQAGIRHVLVEGGPQVAAAFVRNGSVDHLVWYVSPKLLGDGRRSVASLGISTIDDARRFDVVATKRVGDDTRIDLRLR